MEVVRVGAMLETQSFQEVRRLSWWRRWHLGLAAMREVALDPNRTDKVLEAGLYLNTSKRLALRAERFLSVPTARRMYEEDWSLDSTTLDFSRLFALPEGTLGQAYASFMVKANLTPDLFKSGAGMEPSAYVVKRIRQTHDLWHVLTGYRTDVPGEIELQAFTFAQNPNPLSALIVAVGTLRTLLERPDLLARVRRAYRRGKRASMLALEPWELHWDEPLAQVRRRVGLEGVA